MSMPPPPPPPPPSFGGPPPPSGYSDFPSYQQGGQPPAQYASFGARLGAVLIDGLVSAAFSIPGIIAILAGPREIKGCTINGEPRLCEVPTGGTIGIFAILALIGWIAYLVVYCRMVSKGQSWGHKVAGIRVVDATSGANISAGRVLGRQFARILSGPICFLGYLWMLWDPKKQTWHDKIVGTTVLKA